MKTAEKDKLDQIVDAVHKNKKRIRFWALPDRELAWKVAFDSGVDLINTDKLKALREFLVKQRQPRER